MRKPGFVLWGLIATASFLHGQALINPSENRDESIQQPIRFQGSEVGEVETGFLETPDEEKQSEALKRDYETAVSLLEVEKSKEDRRKKISEQGSAFSKEFLRLRVTAKDFGEKFEALLKKYPLAHEDSFCQRLIERGVRIAGKDPRIEPQDEESTEATVLPMVEPVEEEGLGIDLESNDEYQHLRDRLRIIKVD